MSLDSPQGLDKIFSELSIQSGSSQPATPETPTPEVENNTEPTEVESSQTAQTETNQAKSEVTSAQNKSAEKAEESPSAITDWDDDEPTDVSPSTTSSFDFNSLGKDLGYNFKSQEDVMGELKRLKAQEAEYQAKASQTPEDLFANETLRAANELAKNNGDYLNYLGLASINYDAVSDRDLLEDDLRSQFAPTPENEQAIQDYLGQLSETEIRIKGNQVRGTRKYEQASAQNQMIQAAAQQKEVERQKKLEMDRKVESYISSVKDINGFEVKPSHKKNGYESISTGKIYDDLFFTNGEFDPKKAFEAWFLVTNNQKMTQYYKTRHKTEGKREVLNTIQNAELDKPGNIVPGNPEAKSGMDSFMDHIRGLHR